MITAERKQEYIDEATPEGRPLSRHLKRRALKLSEPQYPPYIVTPQQLEEKVFGTLEVFRRWGPQPEIPDDERFDILSEFATPDIDREQTRQRVSQQRGYPLYPLETEGNDHIILMNAPKLEQSTKLVKIRTAERSDQEIREEALVRTIYTTLFPDHFPPTENFTVEGDAKRHEKKIDAIEVKKINKHPQYDGIVEDAKNGYFEPLKEISKNSLGEVVTTCNEYQIPLNLDLSTRNVITDEHGTQWFIDDVYTPLSAFSPRVELNIAQLMYDRERNLPITASDAERKIAREARLTVWRCLQEIRTLNKPTERQREVELAA